MPANATKARNVSLIIPPQYDFFNKMREFKIRNCLIFQVSDKYQDFV